MTTHHSSKSRCQWGRLPPPGGLAIRVTRWRSSAMIRFDQGPGPIWRTTSATRVCRTLGQTWLAAVGGVGPVARWLMTMVGGTAGSGIAHLSSQRRLTAATPPSRRGSEAPVMPPSGAIAMS